MCLTAKGWSESFTVDSINDCCCVYRSLECGRFECPHHCQQRSLGRCTSWRA